MLDYLNDSSSKTFFPKSFSHNKYFNRDLLTLNKLKSLITIKSIDFESLIYQIYPLSSQNLKNEVYLRFNNPISYEGDQDYFSEISGIFREWEDNVRDRLEIWRKCQDFSDSIYLSSVSIDILTKIIFFNIHEIFSHGFSSVSVNTFMKKLSRMIFDSYSVDWNSKFVHLNTYLYNNGIVDVRQQRVLVSPPIWPNSLCLKISSTLLNVILSTCAFHNGLKILNYETISQNSKYSSVLSLSPSFVLKTRDFYKFQADFKIKKSQLPSQENINKWISIEGMPINGVSRSLIKGTKYLSHYIGLNSNLTDNSIEILQNTLNYLGEIPWKINPYILKVIKCMVHSGMDLSLIGIPKKPTIENYETDLYRPPSESSEDYTTELIKNRYKAGNERTTYAENLQIWNKLIKTISIAENYGDSKFYLPYEMDFRGRFYPTPAYFSTCDSDLYRSFVIFGEKKKIGTSGLRWLKIHIANLYGGTRSMTFEDRVNFCTENLSEIKNSVDDPLNSSWWKKAKNPLQFLAASNELCNALKTETPEDYLSGLPIHIDGCCNGLQHYAAITRDETEASLVNMKWDGQINDLYTKILKNINTECYSGILRENDNLSDSVNRFIDRDLVKCIVVGFSYGITLEGTKKLLSIKLKDSTNFDWNKRLEIAGIISERTLEVAVTFLKSTHSIKEWLENLAKLYVNKKKIVRWMTPLNMVIYQPYTSGLNAKVACPLGTLSIQDDLCSDEMEIDAAAQIKGFPANFIHSLDATHMMMTAAQCKSRNIFFSSVHDSYWTHPCCVDELNKV